MHVGIDARLLAMPLTGIGRYTAELSRALIAQADVGGSGAALPDRFYLYMPGPPLTGDWAVPQVRLRAGRVRGGRAARMLWSQTVMPWQAARDGVDVFWGTSHRLPRFLPAHVARVVTIHDLVWRHAGDTMRPLSRWMEAHLMPQAVHMADRIVADSQSTANDLVAAFPTVRERVRVVHLGATPMPAPADRAALASLGIVKPYVLFVGTLEPRKNLRRLLGAWASLPAALRQAHQLVIAGGKGWGGVDVPQLVQALGLGDAVLVLGYVSDAQLAGLYAHARFLAMPSLYEGFGLPLVESMAHGVPVLTANRSAMPEVAGDAGVLVNPLSEADITRGLAALLTDDALHARLAGRAREWAAQFSWARAAQQMRVIFAEAVAERRARYPHHRPAGEP